MSERKEDQVSEARRPAVIYTRVSTKHQAQFGTSLQSQEQECRQAAAELDAEVLQLFSDPGKSGGYSHDRPGFLALVAYIEANPRRKRDGLILCQSTDRFGRFADPEEFSYWRFRCRQAGWEWTLVEEDLRRSTELGDRHIMRSIDRYIQDEIDRRLGRDPERE